MIGLVAVAASLLMATCSTAALPPCVNRYPPRGTTATAGMSNMVLAYMDARSLPGRDRAAAFVWNQSMFETLLAPPVAATSNRSAGFFDGFLFIPNTWFRDTAFAPDPSSNFTTQTDWLALLDLFLGTGAVLLDRAAASVMPRATPKLVLSIPTPDPRAERWGSTAAGRSLNLSVEADRVAAATWFVDVAMDRVAAMGLQHIEMVGFYWYSELIVPADYSLVRAVASHVHSANQDGAGGVGAATSADQGQGAPRGQRKLIFTWIPYFEATGWQSWAELGFDFATMQPNWAFHNHSCCRNATALFARVANDTKCRGMGLEMELPLAVRNPQIVNSSWRASIDSYVAAGTRFGWASTVRSYYYGNDFVLMAREDPGYFEKLYHTVTAVA